MAGGPAVTPFLRPLLVSEPHLCPPHPQCPSVCCQPPHLSMFQLSSGRTVTLPGMTPGWCPTSPCFGVSLCRRGWGLGAPPHPYQSSHGQTGPSLPPPVTGPLSCCSEWRSSSLPQALPRQAARKSVMHQSSISNHLLPAAFQKKKPQNSTKRFSPGVGAVTRKTGRCGSPGACANLCLLATVNQKANGCRVPHIS